MSLYTLLSPPVCLPICFFDRLFVHQSVCLFLRLPVSLFACLSVSMSHCLSSSMFTCLFVHLAAGSINSRREVVDQGQQSACPIHELFSLCMPPTLYPSRVIKRFYCCCCCCCWSWCRLFLHFYAFCLHCRQTDWHNVCLRSCQRGVGH